MTLYKRPLDYRDPVAAFAPFKDTPFALLLHGPGARYSYICVDPLETMVWTDSGGDPLSEMQARLKSLPFHRPIEAAPFLGGWAGLLSYEFGRAVLPRLEGGPKRGAWPDLAFGLYDHVVVFDHETRRAEILAQDWGRDVERLATRLAAKLGDNHLEAPLLSAYARLREARAGYERKIARVIEYVRAGDCFQANLSQALDVDLRRGASPFDLVARLAADGAGPFSAFMRLPGLALASNSPERFLRVIRDAEGLVVSTQPIKGTRPRDETPDKDAKLAADLLASKKDRAENLMIVDLMRNDLARVSRAGSVSVPKLHELKSYRHVHHLVSTVTSRLKSECGPADLLRAAFPGGSITGAPKIRAMQIISELEGEARGPYCGSMVWMSPDGEMDSSILIRTAAFEEQKEGSWRAEFRVGGGIVADSNPADEYDETLDKARSLLLAFQADLEGAAA